MLGECGSVTAWIQAMKNGSESAASRLYQRYFRQLVWLAWRRMQSNPLPHLDGEDVAQSVMNNLFVRAQAGKFPDLHNRNQLWGLIATLTWHKVVDKKRSHNAPRNGGGRVIGENDLVPVGWDEQIQGFEGVPGQEPPPDFVLAAAENVDRLLGLLDNDEQRQIALWRMEDYENGEIAAMLRCSIKTVERRVRLIRDIWKPELPNESGRTS
jgi:DNA-directed RNA polymerase specialized sigma24 family protein